MLGEKLGREDGKVTARRVLGGGGAPTVEASFEATGSLLGVKTRVMATYTSQVRPDGTIFGTGHGVLMGAEGEMASWQGSGVGTFDASGGITFRGALYYYSTSPMWVRLNKVAAVFEYKENPDGSTVGESWEWK
jgi:hypothetical protein